MENSNSLPSAFNDSGLFQLAQGGHRMAAPVKVRQNPANPSGQL
jgi:hypothetical protein